MQINWFYSVFFLLPFQAGGAGSPGGNPIRDQPSPQVTVRQFSLGDAAIPAQLASGTGEPLPVAGLWAAKGADAKSGATWLATARGLLRIAPSERRAGDRVRYFEGKRYLATTRWNACGRMDRASGCAPAPAGCLIWN